MNGPDASSKSLPDSSKPWSAMLSLALGFFITVLDATIVNIAVPVIAVEMDSPLNAVLWIVNIYTLIITAFLITMGRLGDNFGPKKLLINGLVIFVVASFFCGISSTIEFLVLARLLQAIGAAMIMPQIMVIIIRTFAPEYRSWAFGIWGATGGIAAIVGPVFGGFLLSSFGWPIIFFINIPFGILIILLTLRSVTECKSNVMYDFDLKGLVLATLGLGVTSFILMEWNTYDIFISMFVLLLGFVLMILFCAHQNNPCNKNPIVPPRMFLASNYTKMLFVIGLNAITILALIIILSIYLQSSMKYSPIITGCIIAPASLFSTLVSIYIDKLTKRFSLNGLLQTGLFITLLGSLILIFNVYHSDLPELFIVSMITIGIGNGLSIAPMNLLAMGGILPELIGSASAFLNMIRQLGMTVSGAVLGYLLQNIQVDNSFSLNFQNTQDHIIKMTFYFPVIMISCAFLVSVVAAISLRKQT